MEQVVGNKAQSDDGELMALRADDAGALWTASWEYYSTHTHADWTLRRSDAGVGPRLWVQSILRRAKCQMTQQLRVPTLAMAIQAMVTPVIVRHTACVWCASEHGEWGS